MSFHEVRLPARLAFGFLEDVRDGFIAELQKDYASTYERLLAAGWAGVGGGGEGACHLG